MNSEPNKEKTEMGFSRGVLDCEAFDSTIFDELW